VQGRRRFRGRDRRPAALSRHGSLAARTDGTMATTRENGLIKGLGLVDSTTLVMGSMIGSGVFIVAADISRQVQSPGLMMMTWFVTAALTLIAALSYGELAAAMPHAGGQYVYLREAFGPLAGFLFGWTMFAVIQTGTIAAVAVAFAKYTGIFFPSISDQNYLVGSGGIGVTPQQLLPIDVIVFLTWSNTRGIRTGAMVQNVFTFAKVGTLLGLVGAGFLVGRNPAAVASNFTDFWRHAGWNFDSVRLVGVDAIQHADKDRVAAAAASSMFGPVAVRIMAAAIMVSTFGCINGITLSGARVYYAMAKDKLFFRQSETLNPKTHAPVFSLTVQCIWASLLTLSGRYNDLLDYVIFAVLLFYILTIAGLFVRRRTRPDMERPYKAFGYPVLPAIYMLAAGLIEILLLLYKPNYTWPGLIIVLLGLPVYFIWRKKATV